MVDVIKGLGRPDLSESAELGVSELVTNALLHGTPPVSVRIGGTTDHPRVEVHDHSTDPPVLPDETSSIPDLGLEDFLADENDDEDLLVTFGRGLDIVARCAEAWGAEIETTGKVVWFTPAVEVGDTVSSGHVTGVPSAVPQDDRGDQRAFHLLRVPADWLQEFQRHYLELRREVRLLALAHEEHYPLAKTLSDHFGAMHRQLVHGIEVDHDATPSSDGTVDLVVHLPPESVDEMGSLVDLLDFADEFAARERLLSVARTPAQRTFQTWFLTEFVRQRDGHPPRAWAAPPAYRAQA
ncbi:ATP-binding protein [Nocardioides sp.]|uniref:ATP-binding protein n=1 Tax=Nocardioides sp. TaxID=35761 RepID=UPI002ED028A0